MTRSITSILGGITITLVALLISAGATLYAAEPSVETPTKRFQDDLSKRSLQQEKLRERSIKQFQEMCEYIQLEGQQMEKAMKLFDSRIEEMANIFEDSRNEKIDQKKARERLSKSFAEHRDKFEALLSQEQRARLELWENNRSKQAGKKS